MLWAWAVAQYPVLLPPHVTVSDAAGGQTVLAAVLGALAAGSIVLVPSLLWLFVVFQRSQPARSTPE